MGLCAIVIGLMFWGPGYQGDAEKEAIEKSILAINARMTKAGELGDVDALFGFMLENDRGSIIQNGNLLLTRSQALQQIKKNMSAIRSIEYKWKQQHVTVVSPTVALLVAEGESLVTPEQGRSFTAPFAQTVVFVLSDGEWKALHAHQSSPRR